MKILVLNIRSGGGTRVARLLQVVGARSPDVLVLTEWRENSASKPFEHWAAGVGMHHSHLNDGRTKNGVFVASGRPFDSRSLTPRQDSAGVIMEVSFPDWLLLAAYFPNGEPKSAFFTTCFVAAIQHADRPLLLAGDLNTGNQALDRDGDGAPYACSDGFDALSGRHGLVDLWRRTNGAEALEWSWLSSSGNGFRIDHAFGNQSFVDRFSPACNYDHSPRNSGATDHSALEIAAFA